MSRKLAFRLELELSFRNSTGGLGVAWAQVATRGPVFGLPFSSAGLFWTLFIFRRPVFGLSFFARACFWTPLVFHRHVFGTPLSCAGMFLDSLCLPRACFWTPLSSAGMFLHVLCLPRACLWTAFTLSSTMGLFLDPFFGLPGGPFWGSILVPVVRFGAPFWCRWCVLGFPFE